MYHVETLIWIGTALTALEIAFDEYIPLYRFIADQPWHIFNPPLGAAAVSNNAPGHSFSLEMGFIPPLYFAVVKCRRPILRRRTPSLLREAPKQEGSWQRRLYSRIAERVIELEEDGLELTSVLRVDGQKLPADGKRIHDADFQQETTETGMKQDFVNFCTLPLGAAAGWTVKKEYVDL